MSAYIDAVKDVVGDAFCAVADIYDRAATKAFGTSPGAIKGGACNDPTPPPVPPPPLQGGQCSGVVYNLGVFSTPSQQGTEKRSTGTNLQGPISVAGWSLQDALDPPDTGGTWVSTIISSGTNPNPVPTQIFSSTTPRWDVIRNDGQPDNCGDPPPPPPPPIVPTPTPTSVTYINNEGDEVTELGDLTIFAPVLIAPFTLVAPIKFDLGGINLSGTIQLAPEFNISIGPELGGGGASGGFPEEIPEETDDPPQEDEDEPIECVDKPLTGLIVDLVFSENMRATELQQDNPIPAIAVPRVAILYFIALVGNRQVWMPGVDLKSRSQYVPVPFNSIVVCWRIHTEPGVTVRSTRPIYAAN